MASLIRFTKVFRLFSNIARNVSRISAKSERTGTLLQQGRNNHPSFVRVLATEKMQYGTELEADSRNENELTASGSLVLDRRLYKLDQEIRRIGRISKVQVEELFARMKKLGKITSTQALLSIRCCGSLMPEQPPVVRTQLLEDIWNFFQAHDVPMDISHYNALLRVYLENENKFTPEDFLTFLEQQGVEPNRVTYQRLISRYCQEGDIAGASKILEFMKQKDLPINEHVFNSLIMGHANSGDMDNARATLELMQNAGLTPNADTYTMLMCGYARHGDMENINHILVECESKDTVIISKDVFEVLYTLVTNGHTQCTDELLTKIRKSGGYNQDAINLCLRLINVGHVDVAQKLYHTLSYPPGMDARDANNANIGYFFVSQLVKCDQPIEDIVSFCNELKEKGHSEHGLLKGLFAALTLEKTTTAMKLIEECVKEQIPVRQHYFWPILASHIKLQDEKGILQVVKQMQELLTVIHYDTMQNYVLPNLQGSPDVKVQKLVEAGLPMSKAVIPTVKYLLMQNNVKEAADLAATIKLVFPVLSARDLSLACAKTNDVDSILKLLRIIHQGRSTDMIESQINETGEGDANVAAMGENFVDFFVSDLADRTRRNSTIISILQGLMEMGLGISSATAEKVLSKLGTDASETIHSLLAELSSGKLTPAEGNVLTPLKEQDVAIIEAKFLNLKRQGKDTDILKNTLIGHYIRSRNLEKTLSFKQEMEAEGHVFPQGVSALLLDLYVMQGKLIEAQQVLQEMKEKEPDVVLDDYKSIRLAILLSKEGRTAEAIALLSEKSTDREFPQRMSERYLMSCQQLLNVPALVGDVETTQKLFSILIEHKYAPVNKAFLRPMIKVHLQKGDLVSAVKIFEDYCKEYKESPLGTLLLKKLIEVEDTDNLQRVTDLMMEIHGEMNILYDLVCCFIECGRIQQAQRILSTPNMKAHHRKLELKCEQYLEEEKLTELEHLVSLTKDVFGLDRSMMYSYLLQAYCNLNDPDRALNLWMTMQEENTQPSDYFLVQLANFLQEHNRSVPFIVPDASEKVKPLSADRQIASWLTGFRNALSDRNIDEALHIKKRMESSGVSMTSIHLKSMLMGALVEQQRLSEAVSIAEDILSKDSAPRVREFRALLKSLAENGDVDMLEHLNAIIDEKDRRRYLLEQQLLHAHLRAGRIREYVAILEKQVKEAKQEDMSVLHSKFPMVETLEVLKEYPDLLPNYEEMAMKCIEKDYVFPMSTVWMYHLKNESNERVDEIWNKYLKGNEHFVNVVLPNTTTGAIADIKYVEKVLSLMPTLDMNMARKWIPYNSMVNLLCNDQQFDRALEVLQESLNEQVTLDQYHINTLHKLQHGLQLHGKVFPYTLPDNVRERTSSSMISTVSSDSDGSDMN